MQLPPAYKNADFFLFRGRGQGTPEHRLQVVRKFSSEHAFVSRITSRAKWQNSQTCIPITSQASVIKWEKVNILGGCLHQTNCDMSPFECSYCCLSTVTVVWDQIEETSARGLTAPTLTLKIEKEAYVNRGASLLYWSNLFPHWKKRHYGFTHWLCVSHWLCVLFLSVKGKRRKVINLWWISYIWDQFLNQLWVRNKV